MRIEELRIVGYQILQDITIQPGKALQTNGITNPSASIDLLVGVNGTGKSTLLRALAIIFQCLEQGTIPPFGFAITYFVDGLSEEIFVSNLDKNNGNPTTVLRFRQGNDPEKEKEVSKISADYLPRHIIALTSGSEMGWIHNGAKMDEADFGFLPTDSNTQIDDLESFLQDWDLTEVPGKPLEMNNDQIHPNPSSPLCLHFWVTFSQAERSSYNESGSTPDWNCS